MVAITASHGWRAGGGRPARGGGPGVATGGWSGGGWAVGGGGQVGGQVRTPEPHSERAMGAALTRPTGIGSALGRVRACGV